MAYEDSPKCTRLPYWDEMTAEQKIEQLGDVVKMLTRTVGEQATLISKLMQHTHGDGLGLFIPIDREERETAYWLRDPLRSRSR